MAEEDCAICGLAAEDCAMMSPGLVVVPDATGRVALPCIACCKHTHNMHEVVRCAPDGTAVRDGICKLPMASAPPSPSELVMRVRHGDDVVVVRSLAEMRFRGPAVPTAAATAERRPPEPEPAPKRQCLPRMQQQPWTPEAPTPWKDADVCAYCITNRHDVPELLYIDRLLTHPRRLALAVTHPVTGETVVFEIPDRLCAAVPKYRHVLDGLPVNWTEWKRGKGGDDDEASAAMDDE